MNAKLRRKAKERQSREEENARDKYADDDFSGSVGGFVMSIPFRVDETLKTKNTVGQR